MEADLPALRKETDDDLMIKKFWCWIWGHRVLAKAYTGETYMATNLLGEQHTVSMYVWQRFDYCLRCAKDVKGKQK